MSGQSPDYDQSVRDVLAAHFITWHDLDIGGPRGEWRCSCGLKFGFSDSAIDHVTEQVGDVHERGFVEGHQQAMEDIEATKREYGSKGWDACVSMVRALIATQPNTSLVLDLEGMFQAAEDERNADA